MTSGFFKKLTIVYDETYSLVMDITAFRYLINLAVSQIKTIIVRPEAIQNNIVQSSY